MEQWSHWIFNKCNYILMSVKHNIKILALSSLERPAQNGASFNPARVVY